MNCQQRFLHSRWAGISIAPFVPIKKAVAICSSCDSGVCQDWLPRLLWRFPSRLGWSAMLWSSTALFQCATAWAKSCRKFLTRTQEWILHNRHWRRWEQQQYLQRMLRGFYQYFGLHHCERKLNWVRQQVQRQWIHALNLRGQRRKTNWARLKDQPWFKLPFAQNLHPMI
jgi:hypothetical protein